MRPALTLLLALTTSAAMAQDKPALPDDAASALDRITADSLRGHLSFLASDLLEGRGSPSRGLDLAAEYIAAQFRRAGLEPAGDDGFFQVANWEILAPDASSFGLTFQVGAATYHVHPDAVSLNASGKVDLKPTELLKVAGEDQLATLTLDQVAGKAVLISMPEAQGARRAALNRLRALKAALIVGVDRDSAKGSGLGTPRLIDPENPGGGRGFRLGGGDLPSVVVHDPKVVAALDALDGKAEVSMTLGEPTKRPAKLRNVAGLLRGSDPMLKDTYILVTAHYDHIGIGAPVKGDAIYNGANDDGSGTVSVVEVASALATLKERPKRSVLFRDLLRRGARLARLEVLRPSSPGPDRPDRRRREPGAGRPDRRQRRPARPGSLAHRDGLLGRGQGFRRGGGRRRGWPSRSTRATATPSSARANNQAMADLGVPAHTLCVAFMYPDYHGAADHWDKIDYANMARIDRVVARAVLMIAQDPDAPKWNAENKKADRYRKAREATAR